MASDYKYPYLVKTEPRGRILFNILSPHLEEHDTILDVHCGYAPLAKWLLDAGFDVWGFDSSTEAIKHLREKHPNGHWISRPVNEFPFKINFDVILLLGYDWHSFIDLLKYYTKYRLVLLEVVKVTKRLPCHKNYDKAIRFLTAKGYVILESGEFDAELERGSTRIYCLMRKTN